MGGGGAGEGGEDGTKKRKNRQDTPLIKVDVRVSKMRKRKTEKNATKGKKRSQGDDYVLYSVMARTCLSLSPSLAEMHSKAQKIWMCVYIRVIQWEAMKGGMRAAG